jgi:hypothetical protein
MLAPDDDEVGAAASAAPDAGGHETAPSAKAGERVSIPAGVLLAGSTPGDRGRHPGLEPALFEAQLTAFEIDRLPFPNDPSKRPLTGVSRAKASELCTQGGGRLCGDFEWERACRGPAGHRFAGAHRWQSSCAVHPERCATAEGVLAMGGALREWTAGDVEAVGKKVPSGATLRGARADAIDVDHRCAHRGVLKPSTEADDLGFRCCYGARNALSPPKPVFDEGEAFARTKLDPARLREMFRSVPRLARLADDDILYFRKDAAIRTITERAEARDGGGPPRGIGLSTAPLAWNPVAGEQLVVVTGRSGKDSFIVALHRVPGDRYRVGSSMIFEDELGPVVLVYDRSVRHRMHWTTCWECYGEVGNISYRDDFRVVITQQ